MTTPLEGALDFVARDLFVFPVTSGQKAPPLIPNFEANASNDPGQIKAWAAQFENCNFGCAPHRSGHVVIDLDRKPGIDGVAELERLAREQGFELPDTLTVATPSGGFHLYYKGNAPSSAGRIAPGVDVRGKGGYVLVPGSRLHD